MRARNIKPGFFKNEDLAECDPLARILFTGLWCLSDREGRMEYRPKRIKAELLPYDEVDVEVLLNQLQKHGFIVIYEVDHNQYLEIPKFTQHQNCHIREAESSIPAPGKHGAGIVQAPDKHGAGSVQAPDKHGACSVQAPAEHGSSPAESPILNPESPILNPEDSAKHEVSLCPHQEIISLYHKTLPELAPVKIWTPKRQDRLRARWNEDKARQCLSWWESYFERIKASPFLTGNVKDFKADLEWVVNQSNMVKILEGKYDAGGNGNGSGYTAGSRTAHAKTGGAQSDGQPYPPDREY